MGARKGEEREGAGRGKGRGGKEGEGGKFDPPLFFTIRRPCVQ